MRYCAAFCATPELFVSIEYCRVVKEPDTGVIVGLVFCIRGDNDKG